MNQTLRALNGFGLGARPGEPRRIGDPRGWLREQVAGGPPTLAAPAQAGAEAITEVVLGIRTIGQRDPQAAQELRRRRAEIVAAESSAALGARVATERPFVERLVAFWSNHLCVSVGAKPIIAPLAGSYEREVIRPHVLGRFEDMVMASAKHPAMLVYLDNVQSIGPSSRVAQAPRGRGRGAARGLNENYARELLELHTLGVDGGYTQQDVQELARILTGWTVAGIAAPVRGQLATLRGRGRAAQPQAAADADRLDFVFEPLFHEPGAKTVLGVRYAESGIEEGERAIRALCAHPATARFVAAKLVTHFVSDVPPPAAVDRIARVFRATQGDLRAVSAALIDLPEAWSDTARKFRTPQEWVVAVLRAFRAERLDGQLVPLLRQLRHSLWAPQAPKGFGDAMQEWADPDSLLNRAELARTLARRMRPAQLDPRLLLDAVDLPPGDQLIQLAADTSIAADERIALVLASPAFQWR